MENPFSNQSRLTALQNLNHGKPSTFGGVVRDPSKVGSKFRQFISHTLPDVAATTRIVAVCGPTDFQDKASPKEDGWFFSDFYLFHHLLRGVGSSQNWITSEEPEYLVQRYHQYLHGNPHKPRKIVLDQKIVSEGKLGKISVFPRQNLKSNFIQILKAECSEAEAKGDPVLILVFGHGDEHNYGITIGTGAVAKLKISNIRSAISNYKVQVTFLSTSCFSGGWSISPDLNISTFTAAGRNTQSVSWEASATIGRFCGSIWTSAVVLALLDDTSNKSSASSIEDIIPEDANEEQLKAYTSFCGTIFERLFSRVDRNTTQHGITFSAQDDEWEMFWSERSGIPLNDYQKRYEDLESYGISFLEHPESNRDVEMPRLLEGNESFAESERILWRYDEHQRLSLELPRHGYGSTESTSTVNKRTYSGAFGNTMRSLQNQVAQIAKDYLDSHPGADNLGGNIAIHSVAKRCIQGQIEDLDKLIWLMQCLEYRNGLVLLVDLYVSYVCDLPDLATCAEWDPDTLPKTGAGFQANYAAYCRLRDQIHPYHLFPSPIDEGEQGYCWDKPSGYLAAAFLASGFSSDQVEQKLEELKACKYKHSSSDIQTIVH